jgi:hypothetical protein
MEYRLSLLVVALVQLSQAVTLRAKWYSAQDRQHP